MLNIMKFLINQKLVSFCVLVVASGAAMAQLNGHNATAQPGTNLQASPYAGQQERAIKSLSAQDTQDWLDGKGMSLAKAAELNGYPGPMHTLELAAPLQLTDAQRDASKQLMMTHKDEVRRLGADLVQAERTLDQAFVKRSIDQASLKAMTQRIGELQAAIRESHLRTHLIQTAILTSKQVAQYNTLRGYDSQTPQNHTDHTHKH
jgi:Spy/CpxP family protein refolding chaperone